MEKNWLETYCNSTFWNATLLHQSFPSFTPCFQHTVLVWVPCFFLWLFAPYHYTSLKKSTKPALKWSKLHISKLIISLMIITVVLIRLFHDVYQLDHDGIKKSTGEYVSPAVIAATVVLSIFMQAYSRKRGQVSSGLIFLFWFLLLICGIPAFTESVREIITNSGENFEIATYVIYFSLLVSMVFLQIFAEEPPETLKQPQNMCPEFLSSFVSTLFFWWFNPMVISGYKKPLTFENLWNLNPRDESENSAPEFHQYWKKEVEKSRDSIDEETRNVYANEIADDLVEEMKSYNYMKAPRKPSLVKALWKKFWPVLLSSALFKICRDVIQFVNPLLLSEMISFTENLSTPVWQGYFFAACMYIVAVIQAIMLQQYLHRCQLVGMQIRTVIISVIYEKALSISNAARQKFTVGEIVNLMSTDAQRFVDLMSDIHILWSGPLQIIIAVLMLYQVLSYAVFAGLALMIIVIPLNAILVKKMQDISTKNMDLKDQRIKLMNEILNGIKVLKLYGWELLFEKQVLEIRQKELRLSRHLAYLSAFSYFLWFIMPFFVTLASFGVYLALDSDNVLTSDIAFVALSLFDIIRYPLAMFPSTIASVTEALVSVKRLTKFLVSLEIDPETVDRNPTGGHQVVVNNGTFSWDKKTEPVLKEYILKAKLEEIFPVLTFCMQLMLNAYEDYVLGHHRELVRQVFNINLNVRAGELVAVVGHVGSGKSSLISALLGEMEKKKGYVGVKGSTAYVPQQAWIQNNTLRNNILFGKKLISDAIHSNAIFTSFSTSEKKNSSKTADEYYEKVIKATALLADLKMLPSGDQIEIGEKGINLSGGQKQRVSLARAVFADTDVYLLDDPLSAVDSHTGKHIFEQVIGKEGLLKTKTRILVTHGVRYLPHVDRIIVMEKGKITEVGTYDELLQEEKNFAAFLKENVSEEEIDDEEDGADYSQNEASSESNNAQDDRWHAEGVRTQEYHRRKRSGHSTRNVKSNGTLNKDKNEVMPMHKVELDKKITEANGKKLTEDEAVEEGSVKWETVLVYIKAVGFLMYFAIMMAEVLLQSSLIGASIWLSDWTEAADSLPVNESRSQTSYRLGVYGGLGGVQAIFLCFDVCILSIGCLHAAKILHYKMLSNMLRAPIQFFDTNPIGRIVNRFSKDVYTVDETLPNSLFEWNGCMFDVIGIIIVILYSTPEFGYVILPILVLYFVAQRFYVRTSRQLKRLESVTRSPIYSHFSETLSGVTTVRAYGHQRRFILESEERVDKNQKCYYPNIISNRWLAIRLDVIGNAIVFFAALFAVLERGTVTGALAGLSISYALNITSSLNWWVRQTSELEIHAVAVERQKEFADLENEAPYSIEETKPEKNWPTKGSVTFREYSTRYREGLDLVLKKISCEIHSGEKVGIVGRTGAGKSSLTLALFRLIEAAGGKIEIDDVDISKIGLHDLRSKVTIIPQEPVLFSGTLRMNLDPFGLYADDQMWTCLEHSHLKEYVSNLPDKLDHVCSEGGENLSVGQRQLICLARALLRKTRILVLDEATAAVDMQTDDLIQATIRDQFKECTVITIAHRLNTIMDYDRILLLDAGKIAEFDAPSELLRRKGTFYSMAEDAGLA